jgi:hypothetical protein
MAAQLRANAHKPGWSNDTPISLARRVAEESFELCGAISGRMPNTKRWDVLAADVANMAMMVADVCAGDCGRLEDDR